MQCKNCGSHAINHHLNGRDGSDPDLCDVCFWRRKATRALNPGCDSADRVEEIKNETLESGEIMNLYFRNQSLWKTDFYTFEKIAFAVIDKLKEKMNG